MTGTPLTRPGATSPGQRTISGTRMPPSYRKPLLPLSGARSATSLQPPLSEVKTTRVFSARPSSSSAVSSRPMAASMQVTMAA